MLQFQLIKTLHTDDGNKTLDVNIQVPDGQLVTLFGPSGAGKTMILRLLAGLTPAENGSIQIENETWYNAKRGINLPAYQRKLGFVFQHPTLFPHLTVEENLIFALEKRDPIIDHLLDLVGMTRMKLTKANQLSGGQKQRIALIRAVVRRPSLLLLDEPFSALDHPSRLKLQDEIRKIHDELKLTTILVSHDWSEVFKLSDRVLTVEHGKVTQEGTPREVGKSVLNHYLQLLKN